MKTELVLFGKHFSMASRIRRRCLIILFYGAFACLLAASWAMGSQAGAGWVTVEFTVLAGPILGGYFYGSLNLFGTTGLVEPFSGNAMIARRHGVAVTRNLPLGVESLGELHNDERSLVRRDYAHYLSDRFLGTVVSTAFLLEFLKNASIFRFVLAIGISVGAMNNLVYSLLQVGYISFLTLPQAILLWTEPDLEEERA
jgi:hypothetical protein